MTMTCREVHDRLVDYLAGDIPPEQRWGVERHLQSCPGCLEDMEASRNSLRVSRVAVAAMRDPSPNEVPDDLLRAIVAVKNGPLAAAEPPTENSPARVHFSEVPIRM